MDYLFYKLFPGLNNLTKRQKLMFRLLLLSVSMVIFGAYFKINGKSNGDLILILAMIFQVISIIGLLSKWAKSRTISEISG
jgi:peptidoglycan/LPS O-acetylase OafA/YrhL